MSSGGNPITAGWVSMNSVRPSSRPFTAERDPEEIGDNGTRRQGDRRGRSHVVTGRSMWKTLFRLRRVLILRLFPSEPSSWQHRKEWKCGLPRSRLCTNPLRLRPRRSKRCIAHMSLRLRRRRSCYMAKAGPVRPSSPNTSIVLVSVSDP